MNASRLETLKIYLIMPLFLLLLGIFCYTKGALDGFIAIAPALMAFMFFILSLGKVFGEDQMGYLVAVCLLLSLGNTMQVLVGNRTAKSFVSLEIIVFILAIILLIALVLLQHFGERVTTGLSMAASLGIYLYTFIAGKTINGTKAWIDVGPSMIQASELERVLCMITIAALLADDYLTEKQKFFLSGGVLTIHSIFCGAVLGEVGTLVGLWICWLIMIYLTASPRFALGAGGFIGGLGALGLGFAALSSSLVKNGASFFLFSKGSMIWNKFMARNNLLFHLAEADVNGAGRQIILGQRGLMLGGLFGSTSLYLPDIPEQHSECVYSLLIYRMGLVIGIFVLLLFLFMFACGLSHAIGNRNRMERNTMLFFSLNILITSLLSVLGAEGAFYSIGLPTAFFSAGGSQQLITFMMVFYVIYGSRKRFFLK